MHSSLTLTGFPHMPSDITESGTKKMAANPLFYSGGTEYRDLLKRWLDQLTDASDPVLTAYTNSGPVPSPQSLLTTMSNPPMQQGSPIGSAFGEACFLRRLQEIGLDWKYPTLATAHSGPSPQHDLQSCQIQFAEDVKKNNITQSLLETKILKQQSAISEPPGLLHTPSELDVLTNIFGNFRSSSYTPPVQTLNPSIDNSTVWLNMMLAFHRTLLSMTPNATAKDCEMLQQNFSNPDSISRLNAPIHSLESKSSHCIPKPCPAQFQTTPTTNSHLQTLMWLLNRRTSPPYGSLLTNCTDSDNAVNGHAEDNARQPSSSSPVGSVKLGGSYTSFSHVQRSNFGSVRRNGTQDKAKEVHSARQKDDPISENGHQQTDDCYEMDEAQDLTLNEPLNFKKIDFDDTAPTQPDTHKKRDINVGLHRKLNRPHHSSHRTSFRLSQFLRHLLNRSDCNPHLICWVDKTQNTFKLVNSSAVARLWGLHKQKPNMNYETMGRAMRYYYAQNILRKVKGQRLVYQFLEEPSSNAVECNNNESLIKMDTNI